MGKRLVFLPEAEDEAVEAREWYDLHSEKVAPRFVAELLRVLDEVSARPQSFERFEPGLPSGASQVDSLLRRIPRGSR